MAGPDTTTAASDSSDAAKSMKPVDPRLLRYARSSSRFMALVVITGIATTIAIIVQAFALTAIVVSVFTEGINLDQLTTPLIWLVVAVLARTGIAYLNEYAAFKASANAKRELRAAAISHIGRLGPVWMSSQNSASLTTVFTRGIDGLDAYFSRYLPQLVLAVIVPIMVGIVIAIQDPLSAVIAACTLPLIPVFMVLIGMYTQGQVGKQWRTLSLLSGHFADVFSGMTTLKAFGRAQAQAQTTDRIGAQYRRATMKVLRVSFLSALALELLAMVSIALVAVSIGLRLVNGSMTLQAGLLVLILIPEIYLPLRLVGTNYHAAAEGLGAASEVLDVITTTPLIPETVDTQALPNLSHTRIRFADVSFTYPSSTEPVLHSFNATIEPGQINVIRGPSGAGKSTALALLEKLCTPQSGQILIGERDLASIDVGTWRDTVAWVGQKAELLPGSVASNVRLANPNASDHEVSDALAAVGLSTLNPSDLVGDGGRNLSIGQTRRVALARALCQRAQLVLLDEPTASLDPVSQQLIADTLHSLRGHATIVVVSHHDDLIEHADNVIECPMRAAVPA